MALIGKPKESIIFRLLELLGRGQAWCGLSRWLQAWQSWTHQRWTLGLHPHRPRSRSWEKDYTSNTSNLFAKQSQDHPQEIQEVRQGREGSQGKMDFELGCHCRWLELNPAEDCWEPAQSTYLSYGICWVRELRYLYAISHQSLIEGYCGKMLTLVMDR